MIPNKSNFKFQELTPITGVKPYVIRFWETEFPEICPIDSENGQKLYARKDVEAILKIKKLLFEDKLSIPEAKAKMVSGFSETMVENVTIQEASSLEEAKTILLTTLDYIKEVKYKYKW